MDRLNQKAKLIAFLRKNRSISSFQACSALRILRPSNRIQELKADGYDIDTEIVYRKNQDGSVTHYAEYTLLREPAGGAAS